MDASSREALAAVRELLTEQTRGASGLLEKAREKLTGEPRGASEEELLGLADDLFAVARLLAQQPTLRRALSDPAARPDARAGLAVRPTVLTPSRPTDDRTHCARYLFDTVGGGATWDELPLAVPAQASPELLVHPGSGSPRKNWPADRFAAVLRELGCRGLPFRLIVGEADAAASQAVEAALGQRVARLEQRELAELAGRLAGCRAYLGNDSGVSQLAGLVGARSVVLFGPTPAAVWRPLGPCVRVLAFDTPPSAVVATLVGSV
jgi:hypothetical protein